MIDSAQDAGLRRTALNSTHRRMKAKMVPFGGWDMPVEYSGIIPEHQAVRTRAGLFDVSHMGEIDVRGPAALDLVQFVTSNDASRLATGQAQYSGLMTAEGTFVDDLLVHKLADDHYWLVVNASNCDEDFEYIRSQNRFGASVENVSERFTQLALQGPRAGDILRRLSAAPLEAIRYYWCAPGPVMGVDCLIARTGYTGEDGFELYFAPEHSETLWQGILEAGEADGILACGLGARNTLRLEAGMALYGHEIDRTTTALEANLGWIVKFSKGDFLGKAALETQQKEGIQRRLVGFEMVEPGIARDGYAVLHDQGIVGHVTSGSPAPALGKNIGMAYVPISLTAPGTVLEIQIRSRTAKAQVVPTPFYRRAR